MNPGDLVQRHSRTWLVGLVLSLILLRFVVIGLVAIEANWNSQRVDQGYYLQLGLNLHAPPTEPDTQTAGFATSMSAFGEVRGLVSDGARNPLYPLLISVFAERDWAYFTTAKLLNLLVSLAVLVIFWLFVRRQFGVGVALTATALLSINSQFIQHAAMSMCEPLLVLFFVLSWIFIVRGFCGWKAWAIAGLMAGLAYLTKGSASSLVLSFLIAVILVRGKGVLSDRHWLAFPLAFAVTVLPLWVYNTVHFGSPFYSFNYTHALWLDNWYQTQASKLAELPTMGSYLQSHSLSEIWAREWTGIGLTKSLFGYSLMPWGLESGFQRHYVTWAMLLLLGLVLVFRKRMWRFVLKHKKITVSGVILLVGTIAPLSWFLPISPNPRFFLPVLPIFILFVVLACRGLVNWFLERVGEQRRQTGGAVSASACMVMIVVFAGLLIWPLRAVEANPYAVDRAKNAYTDQVLYWLASGVDRKTTVLFGTSHALPLWKYSDSFAFLTVPSDIATWDELLTYGRAHGVRYLIVDYETLLSRAPLLGQFFTIDQRQIEMTEMPPHSALAYVLDQLPANFLVFELLDVDRSAVQTDVRFDAAVHLAGYTLQDRSVQPGQTVRLTLYWRPEALLAKNATVFTQLLDSTSTLRGQRDSQPLRGALPTSVWRTGMLIADRYDIQVAADAPPGDYRVVCGMYTLDDMQRLQATDSDGALPDNQLLISELTVEPVEHTN